MSFIRKNIRNNCVLYAKLYYNGYNRYDRQWHCCFIPRFRIHLLTFSTKHSLQSVYSTFHQVQIGINAFYFIREEMYISIIKAYHFYHLYYHPILDHYRSQTAEPELNQTQDN